MGGFPVVLVVEDEWLLREAIVATLQEAGWEVLEASSGEGALALLAAGRSINVLFTDIQLGGYLSGWDVAEAVRKARPGTPVIYASGNTVDARRRVPGSSFFTKPYVAADVVEACRKAKQ